MNSIIRKPRAAPRGAAHMTGQIVLFGKEVEKGAMKLSTSTFVLFACTPCMSRWPRTIATGWVMKSSGSVISIPASPVSLIYKAKSPFAFTGTIKKVDFELKEMKRAEHGAAEEANNWAQMKKAEQD